MRWPLLFLVLLINGCTSWQSHISRHMEDKGKLRKLPAEHQSPRKFMDTINGTTVAVNEWRDAKQRLFKRSVEWPGGLTSDTIYYANGHYHSIRERKVSNSMPPTLKYDHSYYFDRKGRPLYFYNSYYESGSFIEYRKFYDKEGQLLPKKHEVIYEVLRPSR